VLRDRKMAASASNFDMMRFGVIPRATPRQVDVMIVSGTVTLKDGFPDQKTV